jgi:hypothetical protein
VFLLTISHKTTAATMALLFYSPLEELHRSISSHSKSTRSISGWL